MDAREVARWLVAAEAEWELDTRVSRFPNEQEHLGECSRAGVRASDPSSWSREYRHLVRQDWERRSAHKASAGYRDQGVEPTTGASSFGRAKDLVRA